MVYIQCIVKTTKDRAEFLSDCLFEAGAKAVTFEDEKEFDENPIFEPLPNSEILWDFTKVIGLFLNDKDLLELIAKLQSQLNEQEMESLKFEALEDKDWVTLTQVTEPLNINNKLMIGPLNIKPDLIKRDSKSDVPYLILDPGLAFGTGSHPTTQLCLEFLTTLNLTNKTVLDYGCGSGILGLAALKLGAKLVYAIDHDPQALLSTRNNAQKNNFNDKKIKTFSPEEFSKLRSNENNLKNTLKNNFKIDIIVANILANPLIELVKTFAEYLKENDDLILSGILENQKDLIIDAYSPYFCNFNILKKEDWIAIKMRK